MTQPFQDPPPVSGPSVSGPSVSAGPSARRRWLADLAWLPGQGVQRDVLIEADGDRFTSRHPRFSAPSRLISRTRPTRLHGLTLPGFANAHSHAFHRALRSTTQADRGTFWTWRERMYDVAARLDPDSYLRLARAVFAEMALAGISCVGEFHYLHHQPGGRPVRRSQRHGPRPGPGGGRGGPAHHAAGHLLPGGRPVDEGPLPLAGPQLRFGDGDAGALGGARHRARL